jgi:hypothetical protein
LGQKLDDAVLVGFAANKDPALNFAAKTVGKGCGDLAQCGVLTHLQQ